MFCNTRANAQSCLLWLAQKSHDLILHSWFCLFCRHNFFFFLGGSACSAILEQIQQDNIQ
jgi:hypothetical protein